MSQKEENTKERVVQCALELFNAKGVEDTGVREIAAELGIRPGNVTYYFATKEDLVLEVMIRYQELNDRTVPPTGNGTVAVLLERYGQVFLNQLAYRGMLCSLLHVHRYPKVSEHFHSMERKRISVIRTELLAMIGAGHLKDQATEHLEQLATLISLITRFWLSELSMDPRREISKKAAKRPVDLLTAILRPYFTKTGKKSSKTVLKKGS